MHGDNDTHKLNSMYDEQINEFDHHNFDEDKKQDLAIYDHLYKNVDGYAYGEPDHHEISENFGANTADTKAAVRASPKKKHWNILTLIAIVLLIVLIVHIYRKNSKMEEISLDIDIASLMSKIPEDAVERLIFLSNNCTQ